MARTSLRTKVYEALADQLTDIVVDAVLAIRKPDEPIDLFMVHSRPVPSNEVQWRGSIDLFMVHPRPVPSNKVQWRG